jgi:hypothetical protein
MEFVMDEEAGIFFILRAPWFSPVSNVPHMNRVLSVSYVMDSGAIRTSEFALIDSHPSQRI